MASEQPAFGRLKNKVALVFGTSPYNGGTSAHWMAREGAKLAVCDVTREVCDAAADFLRGRGFDAFSIPGDASQEPSVVEVVAKTVERYGRIDIMLNLAGSQYRHEVLDFNLHDWNDQIK